MPIETTKPSRGDKPCWTACTGSRDRGLKAPHLLFVRIMATAATMARQCFGGATHKLKLFGGKVKLLEWIFNSVSLNGFQTYTE